MAQCTQGTLAQPTSELTQGFYNDSLAYITPHKDLPQTIRIVIEQETIKIYASKTFSYQPLSQHSEPIGFFKANTFLTISQKVPVTSSGEWEWQPIMLPRNL